MRARWWSILRPTEPTAGQLYTVLACLALGSGCAALEDDDAQSIADGSPPGAVDAGMPPFAGLDGGTGAFVPACNPVDGSGCIPGLVCKLDSQPTCVPSPTPGLDREAECLPGECRPGLACLQVSTATTAQCEKLCNLETGEGCELLSGDFECRLRIDRSDWGACVELPASCNPYSQRPCGLAQACQPFLRRTGDRDLRCQPAGPRRSGDPCGARVGSCARGFACVAEPDGSNATCRQYCELNADCPSPEQCLGRVDEPEFTFCLP